MQFDHYGGEAAKLAADLVNAPTPFTPESLEPLLAAHGIVARALTQEQAKETTDWALTLAPCFGAQAIDERCRRVNGLLSEAASRPYVTTHDGHGPHLHYSAPGADPAAHIRAVTAAGLAHVLCHAAPGRLGRCARGACARAYVDTSRNARRAYCTVRCANNDAVARHRARAGDRA